MLAGPTPIVPIKHLESTFRRSLSPHSDYDDEVSPGASPIEANYTHQPSSFLKARPKSMELLTRDFPRRSSTTTANPPRRSSSAFVDPFRRSSIAGPVIHAPLPIRSAPKMSRESVSEKIEMERRLSSVHSYRVPSSNSCSQSESRWSSDSSDHADTFKRYRKKKGIHYSPAAEADTDMAEDPISAALKALTASSSGDNKHLLLVIALLQAQRSEETKSLRQEIARLSSAVTALQMKLTTPPLSPERSPTRRASPRKEVPSWMETCMNREDLGLGLIAETNNSGGSWAGGETPRVF